MARRTSKRFVAAEGQISLFAMDDPTMYEEPAEKPAEKEETQQRLALDFGAQLESYVSQTGGDEATRKDYSFMEQNAPEELARMDAAGETEEYLKAVERNYLTRLAELQDSCMESCGATPEFAQLTMAQCRYDDYIRKAESASKMAEEIALSETVLAL